MFLLRVPGPFYGTLAPGSHLASLAGFLFRMPHWPHFREGIQFEIRRLRQLGLAHVLRKGALHVLASLIWLLLLPLTCVLHAYGLRRVTVFTDRIGHLAMEPDCLLKDQRLGRIPKRRWILLAPPGRVANGHLVEYWSRHFIVFRGEIACFLLGCMSRWVLLRHDVSRYVLASQSAQESYRVYADWGERPPILGLTDADKTWARSRLSDLGLPADAWFVCVHVREGGYSPIDEGLHSHRNGAIEETLPALRAISARGGWVVRIGDPSMRPLPALPGVIDYARHPAKNDRLDIAICALARFILGNTSGIALVGTVFGVPCAQANVIPFHTLWFGTRDIVIPKLIRSRRLDRCLTLEEIASLGAATYRYAALYDAAGLDVLDNASDDILELVLEMLERLDGTFSETPEDRKRAEIAMTAVRALVPDSKAQGRFCTAFLRKHAAALGLSVGTGRSRPVNPCDEDLLVPDTNH